MSKVLYLFIILSFGTGPLEVYGLDKFKTIAVFFASNETIPGYKSILEGFQASLPRESGLKYNLLVEYLDLERFSNDEYISQLVELYNNKFQDIPIDLVVTVGSGAFEALKEHGLCVLDSNPIIAMEIGQPDSTRYMPNKHVIEIQVDLRPSNTMAHAFTLFPGYKNVVIIGGCSASDKQYSALVASEAEQFKQTHVFTYLSCSAFDSILQVVKKLPEGNMVFLSSYVTDANGVPFSTSLALQALSKDCPVPLFTMTDNFILNGGIGGYIISFYEAGKDAGMEAYNILNGRVPQTLRILKGDYYRYQYNRKELKKWNLVNAKAIPPGSTFYNQEIDFYSQYRWQILGVILFVIMQTILITYLIRLVRDQKNVFAQKVRNEMLYRQLLREERTTTMAVLTASLSHELNQPLTAILFNTQAGLRYLQSGKLNDDQAKSILTDIEEDVKRSSGIISSVRSFLQLESRKREELDMRNLIREVLQILHAELEQHQIQVHIQQQDKPMILSGNRIELQQVIINLVLNAVRAMKDNLPDRKFIKIGSEVNHEHLSVSIQDNGIGIPEQMLGSLFEAFNTSCADGLGIGLTLCKTIIERHGGAISAKNLPGGGAEFAFILPNVKK